MDDDNDNVKFSIVLNGSGVIVSMAIIVSDLLVKTLS